MHQKSFDKMKDENLILRKEQIATTKEILIEYYDLPKYTILEIFAFVNYMR